MTVFTKSIVLCIRAYQRTRWLRPASCRFYPSCSDYALSALSKHGILKGLFLSGVRLAKCQPFCDGGVDEVPERFRLSFCRHAD